MSRIAKADVNKALSLAAKSIIDAGGSDGRTSRAEMKATLSTLPKEQQPLVDIFFKFIDHRDFKKGAQVTKSDVDRAVTYAKKTLIAKYDLNNNGLSRDEISKMSLTGKRAVDLAKALKAAAVPDAPPRLDEGFSEPDEIAAAGQVPRDWKAAATLSSGSITHADGKFTGFTSRTKLTSAERDLAMAALAVVWERTFQYRAGDGDLKLGDQHQGILKLGSFKRSDDGKTYLVADWQDIDNDSQTLYFEKKQDGSLRLAIQQING
ncbi:MAG: hypothetical protein SFW67_08520 [Myxococcaceae bacterium]|nr:hypothetical protein [Myxococcaceae bacterium]